MVFRNVEYTDWQVLLKWRNENLQNFKDTEPVGIKKHKIWLLERLASKELFLIFEYCGSPVGYFRQDSEGKISFLVDSGYRGRGFGLEIVNKGLTMVDSAIAEVRKWNHASKKICSYYMDLVEENDEYYVFSYGTNQN